MKKGNKRGIISGIFFLGVCIMALNLVSAENLNLKISGEINGYNSNVRLKTYSFANEGYDVFDFESNPPPSDYSEFYSKVGSHNLAIDTWNVTSNPRTVDLVYYITSAQTGTINFSWAPLSNTNYSGSLYYYGNDATYSSALDVVDMSTNGSYDYSVNSNSTIYLRVIIDDAFTGDPSADRFKITNSSGDEVAAIDDKGELYLAGTASQSQSSLSPGANSFIVQNNTGENVAYFTNTGNLFMLGTISTAVSMAGQDTSNSLQFTNSTDDIVAFFDSLGNLKLRGGYSANYDLSSY